MIGHRPFRFGVLATPPAGAAAWRRTARRAEELGYSALLVPDHLGQEWGPLTALAVAAEHTTRIRLGTLMLAVDLRHPVVLFKELATLAQVAGDRLEIGLGAGWYAPDFTGSGIPMRPAGERIDRLAEAVQILRGLWTQRRFSFAGKHFTVGDASGEPVPPGPVTWMLGGGGRRMLELAAQYADVVSFSAQMSSGDKDTRFGASATPAKFDRRASWVREYAGDRYADIEHQCLVFAGAVVADRIRYAERVLAPMFGLPPAQALESPLALVGTVDEICAELIVRRRRYGISYWVVNGAQLEQFADVVAVLRGT